MLLVKNGRVIDPATQTDAPRDVLLDGDKIAEVAQPGKIAPGFHHRKSSTLLA